MGKFSSGLMLELKARKPEVLAFFKAAVLARLKDLFDDDQLAVAAEDSSWLDRWVSRHFEVCFVIHPGRRENRYAGDWVDGITGKARLNRRRLLESPNEIYALENWREVSALLRKTANWEISCFLVPAERYDIIDGTAYFPEELEAVASRYLELAREAAEKSAARAQVAGEQDPGWTRVVQDGVEEMLEKLGK